MRIQHFLQFLSRSAQEPGAIGAQESVDARNSEVHNATDMNPRMAPDRLALQSAIIHHLEWCVLFNEHLSVEAHQDQDLDPLPSAADSGLGQWLDTMRQGPAASEPRLDEITAEHGRFHQLAQQALGLARQGRMDLASTLLNTDFERSRARVLELLREMQKS
jgi:hypothetical protein